MKPAIDKKKGQPTVESRAWGNLVADADNFRFIRKVCT